MKDEDQEKKTACSFLEEGIEQFHQRLEELIGDEPIQVFGRNVGISDSGLRRYLPPKTSKPSFDKLVAIARYRNVTLDWLATGEGPKHPMPSGAVREAPESYNELSDDFVLIDGYHICVDEAGSSWESEPVRRRLAFRRKWLEYRGLDPEHLKVFFVKSFIEGRMISSGDSVMVNTVDKALRDGVFALEINGYDQIRWIKAKIDGSIAVYSDIESEPDDIVPASQSDKIKVIGRVVWLGKDFK